MRFYCCKGGLDTVICIHHVCLIKCNSLLTVDLPAGPTTGLAVAEVLELLLDLLRSPAARDATQAVAAQQPQLLRALRDTCLALMAQGSSDVDCALIAAALEELRALQGDA